MCWDLLEYVRVRVAHTSDVMVAFEWLQATEAGREAARCAGLRRVCGQGP
jgi:hypothetical protein